MPVQRITLCLAVTDLPRMVATERVCEALGICDIMPIISERVDAADIEQWRQQTKSSDSSAGVTHSSATPTSTEHSQVAVSMSDAVMSLVREGAQVIVLWEDATRPKLPELVESLNLRNGEFDHVAIVVGPRLGLSHSEVAAAVSAGAHTATIGSSVVGNHVAAIAGLMAFRHATRP